MTSMYHRNFLLAGVAMASLALAAGAQAQTKGSSTAQSVQIAFTTDISSLAIEGSETWTYAAGNSDFDTYFTLTTLSGSPSTGQITSTRNQAFNNNECNFWNGTALIGFTRTLGSVSLKVEPKSPGIYDPRTRWTLIDSSPGDPIDLDVFDIFVAGESYMKNNQKKSSWTEKYSFGMGDTFNSRLASLTIELLQDGEPVDGETRVLGTDFLQEVVSGDTWDYVGNGGTFSKDPAILSKLKEGDVNGILLMDDFTGNDGVGGSRAFIEDQLYTIFDEGVYELRFSGVVKGNSVELTADQAFNVTERFITLGVNCT